MNTKRKYIIKTAAILLLGAAVFGADARTKLTTLPVRDRVRIDLKNEHRTLVEEERTVNLQKGRNRVEFAWAKSRVNMASIQFRPVKTPGKVVVLNVNYPPREKALFWEVHSQRPGPAVFRLSYLMSNISKNFSHEAVADKDEKFLRLKTYFTLRNHSGERFRDARLQLRFGRDYTRSFENGESKKILAARFKRVPVRKAYRYDATRFGKQVRMFYEIANTGASGMGRFALPAGKVRIYQEDSSGTEAFLGEDWGRYTPRGKKMSLYLGQAREVKVRRRLLVNKTQWQKKPVRNQLQVFRYRIENFKDGSVPLRVLEHPGGEWRLLKTELKIERGERGRRVETATSSRGLVSAKRKDVNNLHIDFKVPPTRNKKYILYVHVLLKNRW